MAHQKMPSRNEKIAESLNQPSLGCAVKIDHDIPAEDHVKRAPHRPLIDQVQMGKPYHLFNTVMDSIEADGAGMQQIQIFR